MFNFLNLFCAGNFNGVDQKEMTRLFYSVEVLVDHSRVYFVSPTYPVSHSFLVGKYQGDVF